MLGVAANSWKLNGVSMLMPSLPQWSWTLRYAHCLDSASVTPWPLLENPPVAPHRFLFTVEFRSQNGLQLPRLWPQCLSVRRMPGSLWPRSVGHQCTWQTDLSTARGCSGPGLPGHPIYIRFHSKPPTLLSISFL